MTLTKTELGALVKKARKLKSEKSNKKFTQSDLAKEVESSRSYIGDIETGRSYPSYTLLAKIAESCDVPLSFFGDKNDYVDAIIESIKIANPNIDIKDIRLSAKKALAGSDMGLNSQGEKDEIQKSFELLLGKNSNKNGLSPVAIRMTAEAEIISMLKKPIFESYIDYDISSLSDNELIDIANDLLYALRISIERIKNK